MISFDVDTTFVLDLKDDFIMNETKNLYDFIEKNPIKAFYLGMYVNKWFEILDRKQQYLYSKQLRHNKDNINYYLEQIKYWSTKFTSPEVDMIHMSEFIYNNIIWNPDTEDIDKLKVALFLGMAVSQSSNIEELEGSFKVQE